MVVLKGRRATPPGVMGMREEGEERTRGDKGVSDRMPDGVTGGRAVCGCDRRLLRAELTQRASVPRFRELTPQTNESAMARELGADQSYLLSTALVTVFQCKPWSFWGQSTMLK